MINIEQEIREQKIFTPETGVFNPDSEDLDLIPYVKLGLTDKQKVIIKAQIASEEIEDKHLKNVEMRNKLIYWAVVYGISLDDQAAYKRVGPEYIENYLENRLGSFYSAYENLGFEILTESGLDDYIPTFDSDELE